MSKIKYLILFSLVTIFVCSCSCKETNDKTIEYTHYIRGGGEEKLKANILWEYSNNTYTKYQVAYTSYVCSDPSVNYINVIYLEITNKGNKEDALIRDISFSTIEDDGTTFNVGLWGDYKSYNVVEFYEGIEQELLPKLKYAKYDTIKTLANSGYGNYKQIEGINDDLISGGTISASNIVTIVEGIFEYHIDKYY